MNSVLKSHEKLLLTNFLTLIFKLARELHYGGSQGVVNAAEAVASPWEHGIPCLEP